MTRTLIFGTGAVGGYLGGLLALAGNPVTFAARGERLEALKHHGLTLVLPGDTRRLAVEATDRPGGTYDLILLTVKAFSLTGIAPQIPALCHEGTVILPLMNGLPWWYFHGTEHIAAAPETLDPGGVLNTHIPLSHVLGAVAYFGSHFEPPATIRPTAAGKLVLGEPDGRMSPRLTDTAALFQNAGLRTETNGHIRQEVWYKLWGNGSFNPVTALTGQGLADCAANPHSRAAVQSAMSEIQAVAQALGITMPGDIAKRIDISTRLGNHKTSSLQDVEAGRPTEIEALVGAICDTAAKLAVPTPALDSLRALVKLKETIGSPAP